jgi:hypothetical protein
VLTGNYPQTIREMLKARGNWTEVEDEVEAIDSSHFMWRPCNYGSSGFEKISKRIKSNKHPFIFNHFEYIRCICTKTGLIRSLTKYYDENAQAKNKGYSVFDTTPTTFISDENIKSTHLQRKLVRHVEKYLPDKQ